MGRDCDLLVVGGGPAGLTAAIYGRRAGLSVKVLEKGVPGGQINVTYELENYPGFKRIGGAVLGRVMRDHALHFGAELIGAQVLSVAREDEAFRCQTSEGEVASKAVIWATGAEYRKLGAPGEAEFQGRGVSYCAVCDAAFFQDEVVAVVGGGNSAVEEAIYLTKFASKVYIVHRRDKFRADKIVSDRALANPKIEPVWNCVVEEIFGDEMVQGIRVKNVLSGEVKEIPVAGVFIFIGTKPNTEEIKGLVELDEMGYVITDEEMRTSLPGLFAAGDVRKKSLRQVITAAADGAIAAMSAYHYLEKSHG